VSEGNASIANSTITIVSIVFKVTNLLWPFLLDYNKILNFEGHKFISYGRSCCNMESNETMASEI